VDENLNRLVAALDYQLGDLVQVRQIHSADIFKADEPIDAKYPGDGIVTNTPGLLLLMRFADCVPILIVDPDEAAVGIAHAGWKGTIKDVAGALVGKMKEQFGSDPERLIAGIGPSIGPDHYLVGPDVIKQAKKAFQDRSENVLTYQGDRVKFNLWEANKIMLSRAGVSSIEVSEICTACQVDDWFSHRKEKGRTGRFGAVIGLR
jgi:YfiH family protein